MMMTPLLFVVLFYLLPPTSSNGLTDAQINVVRQRLQEGATHRSGDFFLSYLCISRECSAPPLGHYKRAATAAPFTRSSPRFLLLNVSLSPVGNWAPAHKPSSSSMRPPTPSSRAPSPSHPHHSTPPRTPLSQTCLVSHATLSPRSLLRQAMA